MTQPTDAYVKDLKAYRQLQIWGAGGWRAAQLVIEFADELSKKYKRPLTVLDFGAGEGTLAKSIAELNPESIAHVDEYDPGTDIGLPLSELDAKYDIVVATDVLEHVEPALLDKTIEWLKDRAHLGMLFTIPSGPAKATLPSGRNAHLTQQPLEWWAAKFADEDWETEMKPFYYRTKTGKMLWKNKRLLVRKKR